VGSHKLVVGGVGLSSSPCSLLGKDVIAQAQSGTGKTLTFSVAVLQRVNEKDKHVQAVVLSPTRELVMQTAGIMRELATAIGVKVIPLIGGTNGSVSHWWV